MGYGPIPAAALEELAWELDLQLFGSGPRVLQVGGNVLKPSVAKALGMSRSELHQAMEDLKEDAGLSPDYHSTKILSDGTVVDTGASGKVWGNLYDYYEGSQGSW